MELHIEYTVHEDKVTVVSCKGYGTSVLLPSYIKGMPVVRIGAYAFSHLDKSREYVSSDNTIFTERISGVSVPGCEVEYVHGRRLEEIFLPKSLEIIDEYAFYDCRELTVIHMWGGRIQLENGVFMNCEKLGEVNVEGNADDVTSVSGILSEISVEVCATFSSNGDKGVFIFPEFYEDSIENTPARVFHYLIYGAGYRYRQCFEQGKLNILAYDTVFQSAEIQNIKETALKIAFLRIQYPYHLLDSIKRKYLDYIGIHIDDGIDLMLNTNNFKGMIFLTGLEIMSEINYTYAIEKAVNRGLKECASILLKDKILRYPPTEKEFEL
jgi:hypothetical protein